MVHEKNPKIIVTLSGGLDNQLWQYIAGLALQRHHAKSGQECNICLDTSWYQDGKRPVLLQKLIPDSVFSAHLAQQNTEFLVYREPKQMAFSSDFFSLSGNVILKGYFQHYRYFELAQPQLRVTPMPQKYQALQQEGHELVALHVRRGDYTKVKNQAIHGLLPLVYYRAALQKICQNVQKPYILLFSDDLPWVREYLLPEIQQLALPWDSPDGDAIADFSLMASCQHLIIANSSLSALAALFATAGGDDASVYMPRLWHLSLNILSRQMLPPAWNIVEYPFFCTKKTDTPKVSVIIPVYNTKNYLHRCLESVCLQTKPNIEIIIVDDASPDDSQQIIQEYVHRDSRIILIRHEVNRHLGGARNSGIRAAKGEWLLFLDSDDYIRRDTIEFFLQKAKEYPDIKLLGCEALGVQENGDLYHHNYQGLKDEFLIEQPFIHEIQGEWPTVYPTACFRLWKRELFIENDIYFPEHVSFEDLGCTPCLLHCLGSMVMLAEPLFFYQQRPGSLMGGYNPKKAKDLAQVLQILETWAAKTLQNKQEQIWFSGFLQRHLHSFLQRNILLQDLATLKQSEQNIKAEFGRAALQNSPEAAFCSLPGDLRELAESRAQSIAESLGPNLGPQLLYILLKLERRKMEPWYRFGQMSTKRKLWFVAKHTSQKLGIYKVLRPLARRLYRLLKRG